MSLSPGDRYPLLTIDAGEEDALGTSAEAYRVWYQIELPQGDQGWVQAAVHVDYDTGSTAVSRRGASISCRAL